MKATTAARALVSAAAFSTMLVASTPAIAGDTYKVHEKTENTIHFDDWEVCPGDVPVVADGWVRRNILLTIDRATDELVAGRIVMHYVMTLSTAVNGRTAEVRGDRTLAFDDRTGEFSINGGQFRVIVPGEGRILFEAGRYTEDPTGERFRGVEWHGLEALCSHLVG